MGRPRKYRDDYAVGELVRFTSGRFAGQVAVIENRNGTPARVGEGDSAQVCYEVRLLHRTSASPEKHVVTVASHLEPIVQSADEDPIGPQGWNYSERKGERMIG